MTIQQGEEIVVEAGVTFGSGGGETLSCDVYRRPDAAGAPAVLILRSRAVPALAGLRNALAERLARDGIVALVPEFRVGFRATDKGFQPYAPEVWPAGVHDVNAAVRWTRANAGRLSIDPHHLFLLGGSNAGLMALGAAAHAGDPVFEGTGGNEEQSSAVTGVIAISTPTTLSAWGIPLIVGADAPQQRIDEACASRNVHPGFPPVMLLHGAADPMIPSSNSTDMYEALRKAGLTAELHLFAVEHHDLGARPELLPAVAALVGAFVNRYAGGAN